MTTPVTPSPTAPGVGLEECKRLVEAMDAADNRYRSVASRIGWDRREARQAERMAARAKRSAQEACLAYVRSQSAAVVVGGGVSELVAKWRAEADGEAFTMYEIGRVREKLRCAAALESALRAQPGGEGFVVVPREPTHESLRAILKEGNGQTLGYSTGDWHASDFIQAEGIYRAAIAPTRVDVASGMGKGDGDA